jgi:hypothetical protein
MKVWFLILVALFALGLTACKDKKAVEVERIAPGWIGKTIVFLVIPYSKAKNTLKYAVIGDGCTKFKNTNNIWWLCKNNLAGLGVANSPLQFPVY